MKTIKIRNNDPRMVSLPRFIAEPAKDGKPGTKGHPEVDLVPGVNEVDAEYWERCLTRDDVQNMITAPAQTRPDCPMLEVVSEGKALIPKDIRESLAGLNEAQALDMVRDAEASMLSVWAGTEKRPSVLRAIAERTASLKKKA